MPLMGEWCSPENGTGNPSPTRLSEGIIRDPLRFEGNSIGIICALRGITKKLLRNLILSSFFLDYFRYSSRVMLFL